MNSLSEILRLTILGHGGIAIQRKHDETGMTQKQAEEAIRKYIDEAERAYFQSCLKSWAEKHPDMTVQELYKGLFEQKHKYVGADK